MRNLNDKLLAVLILMAPIMTLAQAPSERSVPANQMSFYRAPLACPAAHNLGCGSLAKPVLLALENRNTIQEAWLDHSGTTLAIVWKAGVYSGARTSELQSVAENRGISLHELTGQQRVDDLMSFKKGKGWYRGAQVDKLSEEEAMVIADRLVRRASRTAPTIAGKAESLKRAIAEAIRQQLTAGCTSTECQADCHKKIVDIARKNLNDNEFNALMEAEKQGPRPLESEQ